MNKSMYEFYKSIKSILTGSYDSIHIVSGSDECKSTLNDVSYVEIQKGSNEGWFISALNSNKKDIFFIRINTGSINDAIKAMSDITRACLL